MRNNQDLRVATPAREHIMPKVADTDAARMTRDGLTWHERRAAKAGRERQARENPPNVSHPTLALLQLIRLVERVGENGARREMDRLRPVAMQMVDAAAVQADKRRRRARRPATSDAA